MSEGDKQPLTGAFERHAQTALVLLLVALLLWVGNTTQQTSVAVAEMRVEVAYLKALSEQPNPEIRQLTGRISDLVNRVSHVEREIELLLERE